VVSCLSYLGPFFPDRSLFPVFLFPVAHVTIDLGRGHEIDIHLEDQGHVPEDQGRDRFQGGLLLMKK
jgi:hypothetical protein